MDSVRALRITSVLEGISLILLFFVAMPLKHGFGMPLAVRIVGSAHGGLFLIFVAVLLWAFLDRKWDIAKGLKLFISCLIPFGFLWAERILRDDLQLVVSPAE